ncbi:hypothetical protein E2C01_010926 [Portunus trituberculatus]|uniref:Uncharacterized protein n=1 Tax=Portunus trituberculatus TaxID=210409 RepID=A0A5B7DA09_PORTR|nr:hypothetical protein [Portunus trituberculatus]
MKITGGIEGAKVKYLAWYGASGRCIGTIKTGLRKILGRVLVTKEELYTVQKQQQMTGPWMISYRSFLLVLVLVLVVMVVVVVVVVVVDWYTGAVTIFTEANTAQQYQRQLLDGSTHTETWYESWGACDDTVVSLASQTPHDTGSDNSPQRCQIYPQQIKTVN